MHHPRLRFRRIFMALCAISLFITLWLGHPFTKVSRIAQAQDARQLVQTGVDYYNAGDFLAAIEPWETAQQAYGASQDLSALAIVTENLARAYQQMGRTSEEIDHWEDAIATTKTMGDRQKLGRLTTEQAQAYGRLGQHRRAITLLCGTAPEAGDCVSSSALHLAKTTNDSLGQISALGSLGEAYRSSGNLAVARDYLEQGYALSRETGETVLEAALLNSLGNTVTGLALVNYRRADEATQRGNTFEAEPLRAQADTLNTTAIDHFRNSHQLAIAQQDAEMQMSALLNLMPAYERAGQLNAAQESRQQVQGMLSQLPESKAKAFAAMRLAELLDPLAVRQSPLTRSQTPLTFQAEQEATALLEQALAIGKATENARIESFALGKLGSLDERAGRYGRAIENTQKARLAADQDRAAQDSLYLWEWQLGRIYQALGKTSEANQAYNQAVTLLEQIRSDILSADRDLQFDFRDTVEPIYRQYTALNLTAVPKQVVLNQGESSFAELEKALTTLDSLKVAELQSYFANDCVIVPAEVRADEVGQSSATAVLSMALPSQNTRQSRSKNVQSGETPLTVILSLPNGGRKIAQVPVSRAVVNDTVNQFRQSLELGSRDSRFNFEQAQTLYDWLIRPFDDDLADVETLVFVNDGLMRSVPMAALHDGSQFLVEKYAVATTPSLTLTTPEKLERRGVSALLLGVSEQPVATSANGYNFGPLPAVEQELAALAQQLPRTKTLLNDEFSIEALQRALQETDYRILHMATHGTFGFAPEDNFLVAGAKDAAGQRNQTLTIGQLDELIRNVNDPTREPIELLMLTACETAIGDNRSTLGLAGVAVRAGVRSAIASLWAVNDESTAEVAVNFYRQLQQPDLTKAEALRQAQLAMIQSGDITKAHPYRWAPFILIGNWL